MYHNLWIEFLTAKFNGWILKRFWTSIWTQVPPSPQYLRYLIQKSGYWSQCLTKLSTPRFWVLTEFKSVNRALWVTNYFQCKNPSPQRKYRKLLINQLYFHVKGSEKLRPFFWHQFRHLLLRSSIPCIADRIIPVSSLFQFLTDKNRTPIECFCNHYKLKFLKWRINPYLIYVSSESKDCTSFSEVHKAITFRKLITWVDLEPCIRRIILF